MNRAAAKRVARFRAALIIESSLASGWPHGDALITDEEDQRRLAEAMEEIRAYHWTRGDGAQTSVAENERNAL